MHDAKCVGSTQQWQDGLLGPRPPGRYEEERPEGLKPVQATGGQSRLVGSMSIILQMDSKDLQNVCPKGRRQIQHHCRIAQIVLFESDEKIQAAPHNFQGHEDDLVGFTMRLGGTHQFMPVLRNGTVYGIARASVKRAGLTKELKKAQAEPSPHWWLPEGQATSYLF
jgi:hypothetical protein